MGWASERKIIDKNETEVRGILVQSLKPPSLKLENEAHLGHISSSEAEVLYSASKDVVNSSVGLCF